MESLGELNSLNRRLLKEFPKADRLVNFRAANSVWLDDSFDVLSSYSRAVGEWYDADATCLDLSDMSSIRRINSWCDQKTEGMISKVLDMPDSDAMLYLINSLCFKGEWDEDFKFDKANTKNKDFTNIAGITKKVPTMCNELTCRYYDGEKYGILKMDFGNGAYSMYIVLPAEDSSLKETVVLLDGGAWNKAMEHLYGGYKCKIEFPKFKIDSNVGFIPYLKHVGVKDVFDAERADLSAISSHETYVAKAFQISGIEVDENGAEAASVTVVEDVVGSVLPEEIDFIMNRPFAFVIEETSTKTILFMGCVKDL